MDILNTNTKTITEMTDTWIQQKWKYSFKGLSKEPKYTMHVCLWNVKPETNVGRFPGFTLYWIAHSTSHNV